MESLDYSILDSTPPQPVFSTIENNRRCKNSLGLQRSADIAPLVVSARRFHIALLRLTKPWHQWSTPDRCWYISCPVVSIGIIVWYHPLVPSSWSFLQWSPPWSPSWFQKWFPPWSSSWSFLFWSLCGVHDVLCSLVHVFSVLILWSISGSTVVFAHLFGCCERNELNIPKIVNELFHFWILFYFAS